VSLRFCSLGSGSRGNALLVESQTTLLLIDCGLPLRVIEERMRQAGREPADITAVLITHEHGDHCRGIGPLQRRYGMPVWMTHGTAGAITGLERYERLNSHAGLTLGSIDVEPFPVPHDAREPCQFVFASRGRRLGLLTDAGHVTAHIESRLRACDALALEFNHDREALENGPYPAAVKARVGSSFGHLSNGQTVELLERVEHAGLRHVLGLHLSEQNNSPELVTESLRPVLERGSFELALARQHEPTPWFLID
jgi:phosphoribosyl 1,2-cyclic phosphodiesterase